MSKPVVGLEARRTAPGQDDAGSGDPVGFLSVDPTQDGWEREMKVGHEELGLRGINARVVQPGAIRVGDLVRKITSPR